MPGSSTVYSILVNAPVPSISLSANALDVLFVLLSSSNIASAKSDTFSALSISKDFLIKFSLKRLYCFLACCSALIILSSLSHNISIALDATPLCFKNLFALPMKSEISLKLDTPGKFPTNLLSNSNAVLTWSTACPNVNVESF